MSSEYINTEVDKIMGDNNLGYPQNLAMAAAWLCGNFKGINLKILDVSESSSLADFFVISSASNMRQAQAMADEIVTQMKRSGHVPLSKEGMNDSDWILIDEGDVLVHIFQDASRDVYALDSLWKEAKSVQIPQSYYFSSEEAEATSESSSDRGFF